MRMRIHARRPNLLDSGLGAGLKIFGAVAGTGRAWGAPGAAARAACCKSLLTAHESMDGLCSRYMRKCVRRYYSIAGPCHGGLHESAVQNLSANIDSLHCTMVRVQKQLRAMSGTHEEYAIHQTLATPLTRCRLKLKACTSHFSSG